MKYKNKILSIFLAVAFLLPVFPLSEITTAAGGSVIMYINDVPIDADRCGFTDGSGAKVPLIVGVQNGVVRFRVASAKIDIYLNPSSPLQDATITSTSNNTNITFGTTEMPLEEVYTLICGTYTVLLLPTSPNENHVQYWFNEYDTSDSNYSYFIDKSGTATYNTDSGYNGGHTTFNFYTRVFRVNQGRLYDPVNLSNPANVSTDGITLVKFDLIDNTDGAKEPIWPTSGGYDGAIYTVNSGALTLSGNLLVNGVFPASQYGVKFKIRNGSNNDISYYISLSGAQVIPISSVDDSLRRWNDMGSILSSITYKNTDTGPSITIGLADLYNNFASELGSASYGTVLTNNPANAQQAFNEFYLFYSRGMGSGALYSNSNDHMRFTMFINKILNSTGAQYLQKKGLPDIQDGAIITAQFDRVIGIRMYMHEEQNQYYLYNNTPLYGKQYFERKTSGGAYFPIEIKGSVQYGGFLNNYGSALGVEPFPIYKESIYKDDNNVQYQIWGYCLTHSTPSLNDLDELYCLTGENGVNPDITPFYWSDITIQNWLNTKMFTETFKYVQSPDAKIGLKAEVMRVNGSASTTVPAQILCNGTTYATTSPGNNVDLNVNKNDSIKIDKVSYTIDGKTYISYPKISFTYGGTVAGGYDSGFQYNPSNNKLTIYVRELTVYTVDYNVNDSRIPSFVRLTKKMSQSEIFTESATTEAGSDPTSLTTFFICGEEVNIYAKYDQNYVDKGQDEIYASMPIEGISLNLSSNNQSFESGINNGTFINYTYDSNNSQLVVKFAHMLYYYMPYGNDVVRLYPITTNNSVAPSYLNASTNVILKTTQQGISGFWYTNRECTVALSNSSVSHSNLQGILETEKKLSLYFAPSEGDILIEIRLNNKPLGSIPDFLLNSLIDNNTLGENLYLKPVESSNTSTINFVDIPITVGKILYGDLNFDGIVDANDESLLYSTIAGVVGAPALNGIQCKLADFNEDGLLNKFDLQYIRDCIQDSSNVKFYYVYKGDFNGDFNVDYDDFIMFDNIKMVYDNLKSTYDRTGNISDLNKLNQFKAHNIFSAADVNNDGILNNTDKSEMSDFSIGYGNFNLFYETRKYGNVDFSAGEIITSRDYISLRLYLLGIEEKSPAQLLVSDVNHDGVVDALDYVSLRLYVNGYVDSLGYQTTSYVFDSANVYSLYWDSVNKVYYTDELITAVAGEYGIFSSNMVYMNKVIQLDNTSKGYAVLNFYSVKISGDTGMNPFIKNDPVIGFKRLEYDENHSEEVVYYFYEKEAATVSVNVIQDSLYLFKNWRDGGSAGNIVSSNKEYSFYPSKETNLYAEGRVNTYVVINIDNSNWSTIEPDTNFKSDLYIMKSDGTKIYPVSYDNGTYRFEGNVGTEYGVYMKGNYCNVDVNGGSTAYVNFYTLKVYQYHVLNAYGEWICDDNPFESVSIIGTSSKYYNSLVYKKGASMFLPDELSNQITGFPFLPNEEVSIVAVPLLDKTHCFNYWSAELSTTGLPTSVEFLVSRADINGDDEISNEDVQAIYNHYNGSHLLVDLALQNADINEDGRVDDNDAKLLDGYIKGNYLALHSSQTIVMPSNSIRLIAFGDCVYVDVEWRHFYAQMPTDTEVRYYDSYKQKVKYESNFFEIPHSDFFEGMVDGRNDYVIHNCWYDESGNLVIFDNTVAYMATEDKVYTAEYVRRVYTIEYYGTTVNESDVPTRIKITNTSPHYYYDEVSTITSQDYGNEYDYYYDSQNELEFYDAGKWICTSGTVDPINEGSAFRVNNDYVLYNASPTDINVVIVFEKLYYSPELEGKYKVEYFIYNPVVREYQLRPELTGYYDTGEEIVAAQAPSRGNMLFDGWHWYTPNGTMTAPEIMGEENIQAYGRYVQLDINQSWESTIELNKFRRGTDVVLSFSIRNISDIDYTTSLAPVANITIFKPVLNEYNEYEQGDVLEIKQSNKYVLVPAGETTIVWVSYHIDEQYDSDIIGAMCEIQPSNGVSNVGFGMWYVESTVKVQTPDTAYSPQKACWYNEKYNISHVDLESSAGINSDIKSSVSWVEWYEPTPGNFVKFVNTASIDYQNTQTYIAPYGDNNAIYNLSDMTWNTKSGYGFTLLGQVKIKYNNYDNVRSGAITFAQNANVLFPEFAYTTLYHNDAREYITYNKSDVLTRNGFKNMLDSDNHIVFDAVNNGYYGTYASLKLLDNGNFTLPLNTTTMKNLHYTPLWMPDGGYQVMTYYYDIWTPAGMLSYYSASNALNIKGDMYDDIWMWSQSYNP